MTIEQRIYEANKIMEWFIDGYFTNCILKCIAGKGIDAEWIVRHFNVEMDYFRPHLKIK